MNCTNYKCPKCGRLHAAFSAADVSDANLPRLLKCSKCGAPTADFVCAMWEAVPAGFTLQPVVVPGVDPEASHATEATVFAVIPEFKQVRVEDEDGYHYAITEETWCVDFDRLQIGQRLRLAVNDSGRVLRAVPIGGNEPRRQQMTMPDERTRSVMQTREFLKELRSPAKTPRVPKHVRDEARRLLRHYPSASDLDWASVGAPWLWGPASGDDK